ncbi:aldehyde dehydrogenase family protein [Mesorhizobium metallidurans]|uniref:aldehyde dehydrogenase family protein n=1 Tax=Mesorhizobium metallidurans TaxID=489722 RepID=UPI000A06F6CB
MSGHEIAADDPRATAVSLPTDAFIWEQHVSSFAGETFRKYNPANGRILCEVAACDADDVDRAVKAARGAFENGTWSRCDMVEQVDVRTPFGGFKQSGNGRDLFLHAFEKYPETKTTWIRL